MAMVNFRAIYFDPFGFSHFHSTHIAPYYEEAGNPFEAALTVRMV
jgi:hypothetical protein